MAAKIAYAQDGLRDISLLELFVLVRMPIIRRCEEAAQTYNPMVSDWTLLDTQTFCAVASLFIYVHGLSGLRRF